MKNKIPEKTKEGRSQFLEVKKNVKCAHATANVNLIIQSPEFSKA